MTMRNFPLYRKKRSGKKKPKSPAEEKEEELMSTLSDTVQSVGDIIKHRQTAAAEPSDSRKKDCHDVWAELLAVKIRKMPEMKAEEFKLKVDTMALDVLKGDD